jgi:PAS domain S-box-containing protein
MMHALPADALAAGLHAAAFYDEMWQCIAGGKAWRGEICNRRKSGELYWVEATIGPDLDSAGLPCRYVSIRTDISAVKHAQRRAEVAEERCRRSQTFADIGSWDLDLRSNELYWSERIAPLFGYAVGELDILDLVPPHARAEFEQAIAQARQGRPAHLEFAFVRADGTQVPQRNTLAPVLNEAGAVTLAGPDAACDESSPQSV